MNQTSWAPPDSPDPHAILHEGIEDMLSGHYELALGKFLWFHNNALKYASTLSDVRLSFALMYWNKLAKKYPPAMDALTATRDKTESECLTNGFEFESFHTLVSLNKELGVEHRTVEAFKQAHEKNPVAASKIYHVAERVQISHCEYSLCGLYLCDPEFQLKTELRLYRLYARGFPYGFAGDERKPPLPGTAAQRLTNSVATLVALLVINDRKSEAGHIASLALQEVIDPEFKTKVEQALNGTIPSPYP